MLEGWFTQRGGMDHVDLSLWHMKHLYENVSNTTLLYPKVSDVNVNGSNGDSEENDIVLPSTLTSSFHSQYRIVIALDASPSCLTNDIESGQLFFDLLSESVKAIFSDLLKPMKNYTPEYYISIIAFGTWPEPLFVLSQNIQLTAFNQDALLTTITDQLRHLENKWASNTTVIRGVTVGEILEQSVYIMQFLPTGCTASILLITDGVADIAYDDTSYDNLCMQLSRQEIQCNIVQIGSAFQPNCSFGYVPDVDGLSFLAENTGGGVFPFTQLKKHSLVWELPVPSVALEWTALQKTILIRSSSVGGKTGLAHHFHKRLAQVRPYTEPQEYNSYDITAWKDSNLFSSPLWRYNSLEYKLRNCRVADVLLLRIKEGFCIVGTYFDYETKERTSKPSKPSSKSLSKFNLQEMNFCLRMVLRCHHDVWLEYIISPAHEHFKNVVMKKDEKKELYIRINVLAKVDFIRQLDAHSQENITSKSCTSLKTFIREIQNVDRVLLHLLTVSTSTIKGRRFRINNNISSSCSSDGVPRPVLEIIADLSNVLWHRCFDVEKIQVISMMNEYPIERRMVYDNDEDTSSFNHERPESMGYNTRSKLMYPNLPSYANSIERAFDAILTRIEGWSRRIRPAVFVKFLEEGGGDGTAFCLIRIEKHNEVLLSIHVAFFGTNAVDRSGVLDELRGLCKQANVVLNTPVPDTSISAFSQHFKLQESVGNNAVCRIANCSRLLSPLILCTDGDHSKILCSYLWHQIWTWSVTTDAQQSMMHLLHVARKGEGFWLLDFTIAKDGSVASLVLGKEVEVAREETHGNYLPCMVQYSIEAKADTGLTLSIWMEPVEGVIQFRNDQKAEHSPCTLTDKNLHQLESEEGSDDDDVNREDALSTRSMFTCLRDHFLEFDVALLSASYTFYCIFRDSHRLVDSMSRSSSSSSLAEPYVATQSRSPSKPIPLDVKVPPFSTARLLSTAMRSTESLPMYQTLVQEENSTDNEDDDTPPGSLSVDNKHLYTMIEHTLLVLSDCEVAWTSLDGNLVIKKEDTKSSSSLSNGRCFAKIVNPSTLLLAFLPALDEIHRLDTVKETEFDALIRTLKEPLEVVDASAVEKRVGSVDDSVLITQRSLSFREGYKSWRMGGCHGSTDEKSSDVNKTDEKGIVDLFDSANYGQDVHLGPHSSSEQGRFCVAFYECSQSHFLPPCALQAHDHPNAWLSALLSTSNAPRDTSNNSTQSPCMDCSEENSIDRLLVVSKRFRKKIVRAHKDNFARGVYDSLRQGRRVSHSDVTQALETCVEMPLDLDLTALFNVYRNVPVDQIDDNSIDERFIAVISDLFSPIEGYPDYFYFKGTEESGYEDEYDNAEEEEEEDMEEVLEQQRRHLLHTEEEDVEDDDHNDDDVVDGHNDDEENEDEDVDIENLNDEEEDPEEEEEVDTEVASVASTFKSPLFFIRLDCRIIDVFTAQHQNHDQNNIRGTLPPRSCATGLSIVLRECAEHNVSKCCSGRLILRLVACTLANETHGDRSVHPDRSSKLSALFDEITTSLKRPTSSHSLKALDTVPLLHRNVLRKVRAQCKSFAAMQMLEFLLTVPSVTTEVLTLVVNTCRGLPLEKYEAFDIPIRFLKNDDDSVKKNHAMLKQELLSGKHGFHFTLLDGFFYETNASYWSLLQVDNMSVHVIFWCIPQTGFSQRLHWLTSLRWAILQCVKCVNQYNVLAELHELRVCSPLLIHKKDTTTTVSVPIGWWPGQLACDLQLCQTFTLHDRLSAPAAISSLCGTALQHFQISNQRQMFVYQDSNGNIFYMRLKSHKEGKVIYLQLYGVEPPDEAVSCELRRLCEKRLDDATRLCFAQLLSRNRKFQVTISDMRYLMPSPTKPDLVASASFTFSLVKNVHCLMQIVRQQFYRLPCVNRLNLSSLSSEDTGQHPACLGYGPHYCLPPETGLIESESSSSVLDSSTTSPIFWKKRSCHREDSIFLLNFTPEIIRNMNISNGANVGRGIAIVEFEIYQGNKNVQDNGGGVEESELNTVLSSELLTINNKDDSSDTEGREDDNVQESGVIVKMWSGSGLFLPEVLAVIERVLKQGLLDYYIEYSLQIPPTKTRNKTGIPYLPVDRALTTSLDSPSISYTEYYKSIAPWDVGNVVRDLYHALKVATPSVLWPVVYRCNTTPNTTTRAYSIDMETEVYTQEERMAEVEYRIVCRTTTHADVSKEQSTWSSKSSNEPSRLNVVSGWDGILFGPHRNRHSNDKPFIRTAFYTLKISHIGLRMWTYNWNASRIEQMLQHIVSCLNWTILRRGMLNSILLQKAAYDLSQLPMIHLIQPPDILMKRGPLLSSPDTLSAITKLEAAEKLTAVTLPLLLVNTTAPRTAISDSSPKSAITAVKKYLVDLTANVISPMAHSNSSTNSTISTTISSSTIIGASAAAALIASNTIRPMRSRNRSTGTIAPVPFVATSPTVSPEKALKKQLTLPIINTSSVAAAPPVSRQHTMIRPGNGASRAMAVARARASGKELPKREPVTKNEDAPWNIDLKSLTRKKGSSKKGKNKATTNLILEENETTLIDTSSSTCEERTSVGSTLSLKEKLKTTPSPVHDISPQAESKFFLSRDVRVMIGKKSSNVHSPFDPLRLHGSQVLTWCTATTETTNEASKCADILCAWGNVDIPEMESYEEWIMLRNNCRTLLHRRMPFMMLQSFTPTKGHLRVRHWDPVHAYDLLNLLSYETTMEGSTQTPSVSSLHAEYTVQELKGSGHACNRKKEKVSSSDSKSYISPEVFLAQMQNSIERNMGTIETQQARAFSDLYLDYLKRAGYRRIVISSNDDMEVKDNDDERILLFLSRNDNDTVAEHLLCELDFGCRSVGITLYHLHLSSSEYPTTTVNSSSTLSEKISWGQKSLNLYTQVYDYIIQDAHYFLCTIFTSNVISFCSTLSFRNIATGLLSFLSNCPVPPEDAYNRIDSFSFYAENTRRNINGLDMQQHDNHVHQVEVSFSILLRYIACHAARYEVHDLLHHGSCDAVAVVPGLLQDGGRYKSEFSQPVHNTWSFVMLVDPEVIVNNMKIVILQVKDETSSKTLPLNRDEVRSFIERMCEQARRDFRRDVLWTRLLHHTSSSLSSRDSMQNKIEKDSLEECLLLSTCTPMEITDPQLWLKNEDMMKNVREMYPSHMFHRSFDDSHHILLRCPTSRDIILHVTILQSSGGITAEICRREEPMISNDGIENLTRKMHEWFPTAFSGR